MAYKHEPSIDCSRCEVGWLKLNESGICANCQHEMDKEMQTLGITPEVHNFTTTVYKPTPGAMKIAIVSSLITCAVTLAGVLAVGVWIYRY